jgi:hypothetical protein
MFDEAAVLSWLRILHGDAPGLVNVVATDQWSGKVFRTDQLDQAAAYAAQLDEQGREGIYARVTTLRPDAVARMMLGSRGGVDATLALPALWADLDIAGPGHKSTGVLPPSEELARDVVAHAKLPEPTLWVHSGGGLYPIWLLDRPHVIDDDLADVADLAANWQRAIGLASRALGWHYGTGVGDLARVLRIPGTVNRKAGQERPCRIVEARGTRYPLGRLYGAVADALAALAPPEDETRDRLGESERIASAVEHRRQPGGPDTSPGDDFAARTDWADLLQPHGWRLAYQRGGVRYWRRPGKDTAGISATTNALGTDRLRVFSTATGFEATSYSKLGALAVLEHGGDIRAAARALHGAGFGTPAGPTQTETIAELVGGAARPDRYHGDRPVVDVPLPDRIPEVTPPLDDELLAEVRYREEVAAETRRQRIRRDAQRRLSEEDHEAAWREPPSRPTLVEELEIPDDPTAYRVDRLLPARGNAVLVSQFKAGKTTLCNNLIRSLADGEPFLGRFDVAAPTGRVAVFNYEVAPDKYRAWLRGIGIGNADRVCVLNLRGYRLPLTVPQVETWVAKWLAEHKVSVWVVDPFAAAFSGCGEENSNTDVGLFLSALDVIKDRAGVDELILPVHTGRVEQEAGQERARGATRLDDWADARWLLTVDDQGRRYFRANGRDVDVDEELLQYDAGTHRLTLGGWDRRGMRDRDVIDGVVAYVEENPGQGVNEIVMGLGRRRIEVTGALREALARRQIVVHEAARNKRLHYPSGALPPVEDLQ